MGNIHFSEAAHEEEGDDGTDRVGDEDVRAGEADGEGRAEEEFGADRAADGDHQELGRGEAPVEVGFAGGNGVEVRGC